jgi:hypothetical protein
MKPSMGVWTLPATGAWRAISVAISAFAATSLSAASDSGKC